MCNYFINQWLEFDQTSTDTSIGGGKKWLDFIDFYLIFKVTATSLQWHGHSCWLGHHTTKRQTLSVLNDSTVGPIKVPLTYWPCQVKRCLQARAKCTDSESSRVYAVSFGHSLSTDYLIMSNDSVSGQRNLWSACADAQADLGFRYPHTPEDALLLGAAHFTAGQFMPLTLPYVVVCSFWNTERNSVQYWPGQKVSLSRSGQAH